jgi:hypothetical protein
MVARGMDMHSHHAAEQQARAHAGPSGHAPDGHRSDAHTPGGHRPQGSLWSQATSATLLAREAGLEVPVDDDLAVSLAERQYLQHSIGTVGLLALKPLQITSYRDTWHRHLLQQGRTSRAD